MNNRAIEPTKADDGSNGFDLYAADMRGVIDLQPGQTEVIETGIAVEFPPGVLGFITPRSGMAAKHGITVQNAPGLIDNSYRNSIGVILHNTSNRPYAISAGDRIAQLVPMKQPRFSMEEVSKLSETVRGKKGFGSSGK